MFFLISGLFFSANLLNSYIKLSTKSKQHLKKYSNTFFKIIVAVEAPNRLVFEIFIRPFLVQCSAHLR